MQKVLIIEDELNIAELERDYLEVNGFKSDIATTGEEGLMLANANTYSLILLDLMLPGVDGFDLCKKLRLTLDIPILMVTARKEDIDKIRGFDRGADDYIVKPFNPNELVARVKAHLSRYDRLINRGHKQGDIQIGGLMIQSDARQVFVNGEERVLTAKEFDLLKFLAANANIVRKNILLKAFGDLIQSEILRLLPFILERLEKRLKQTLQIRNLSKLFGV